MTLRPPPALPPLTGGSSEPCGIHPGRAGAYLCAKCGRGHCDECRSRTSRRITPLGTCLQCGGRLVPVHRDTDDPGLAGFIAIWRDSYGPLGLMSAAALGLPVLYGSVALSVLVPAVCVTVFCAWTYFMAVLRWRLTGHLELPMPARALEEVRGAMAVLGTLLAVVVSLAPALAVANYTEVPLAWLPLAIVGVLWLPLPLLTGAGTASPLAPLLPLPALKSALRNPADYLTMATSAALQSLVLAGLGWVLARWLVFVPALGLWLVCISVLPGAWAIASHIGVWGRRRLDDLAVEDD